MNDNRIILRMLKAMVYLPVCASARLSGCLSAYMHTPIHTHTSMRTHPYTHTNILTHVRTHTRTHNHTHANIHIHTRTNIRTHGCTYTSTSTYNTAWQTLLEKVKVPRSTNKEKQERKTRERENTDRPVGLVLKWRMKNSSFSTGSKMAKVPPSLAHLSRASVHMSTGQSTGLKHVPLCLWTT